MLRFFYLLITCIVICLAFVIGVYNQQPVQINLLVVNYETRLATLVAMLLAIGGILGIVISLFVTVRKKMSSSSPH